MKLSKAIEILEDLQTTLPQFSPDDRRDAVKLGIEAMEARQRDRAHGYVDLDDLLPGETEE